MSSVVQSVSEAVQRLSRRDSSLKGINLYGKQLTDAQLAELADCLLAHPDVGKHLYLGGNRLTDETGVKLARYIAASSTVEFLDLSNNQFGSATYLALAAALRVNSSLQCLFLFDNQTVDQAFIDAALIEALWLNPDRPAGSVWWLYSHDWDDIDFKRLRDLASELGHPSLQLLLAARLLTDNRLTTTLH